MIIIAIEGVLAEPGPSWVLSAGALTSGRKIYDAFVSDNRVVLLSSDPHPELYRAWLLKEHFKHFSEIHAPPLDSPVTVAEWKIQKLRQLAAGGPIWLYLDTDPDVVAEAVRAGISSSLVVYPASFIGKAPETRYTGWYDLVDTIEQQNLTRAARGLSEGV